MLNLNTEETYFHWVSGLNYFGEGTHEDYGRGDGLWRTSMALIAYKNDPDAKELSLAIRSCFRKFTMINKEGKHWYQLSRAPHRYREDDVSRDQLIMAISALYLTQDVFPEHKEFLEEVLPKIPYRISRRFRMSLTLKAWIHGLLTGNFTRYKWCELITRPFINGASKLTARILGYHKEYSLDFITEVNPSMPYWTYENGKWYFETKPSCYVTNGHKIYNAYLKRKDEHPLVEFLYNNVVEPGYSKTLGAFMAHIAGIQSVKNALWRNISDKNLLLARLLSQDVSQWEITPTASTLWNLNFNGICMVKKLSIKESAFNYFPIQILTQFPDEFNK